MNDKEKIKELEESLILAENLFPELSPGELGCLSDQAYGAYLEARREVENIEKKLNELGG